MANGFNPFLQKVCRSQVRFNAMRPNGVPREALGFCLLVLCCAIAKAGTVTPPQEYVKYVGRASAVEAFADFGDQVNLRDGSFQFRVTDFELPGTGPTIRFTRTFKPNSLGQYLFETSGTGFGGWEVEVPRIKTVTSVTHDGLHPYSPVGWQVVGTTEAQKNARCTRFSAPDRISIPYDASRGWNNWEWWNGYHLVDDGGNDQLVMSRTAASVRPEFALMTTGNWLVGCLPATTTGEPGEAFYALAPDGTKFWFNHLVYTPMDDLIKPLWSNTSGATLRSGAAASTSAQGPAPNIVAEIDTLNRNMGSMLVTRIEDRFGNWVTYHYTAGKLDSIDASDGRHVGLAYPSAGNTAVTIGSGPTAKTWLYAYVIQSAQARQQLTVTRPDGATWQYSLPSLPASSLNVSSDPTAICSIYPDDYDMFVDGTIVSPTGATLVLRVNRKRFGRSYVPKQCWGGDPALPPDYGYAKYPKEWYAFAVTSRTVSGPGLAPATWSYAYAAPTSSWQQDCPTSTSCASTVWTDVTAPDGTRRRSIFSNKFDETENKLLREEDYAASGPLLRAKDYTYATVANGSSNPYPWPMSVGNDQQTRQNPQTSGQWAPVRQTVTTQQGRTFLWQVPFTCGSGGTSPCFDTYARPTKIIKSSTP